MTNRAIGEGSVERPFNAKPQDESELVMNVHGERRGRGEGDWVRGKSKDNKS